MKGLTFIADGKHYCIDAGAVLKVCRPMPVTPVVTAPPMVVGITNMRGKIVSVLDPGALFGDVGRRERVCHDATVIVCKPVSGQDDMPGFKIDKPGDLTEDIDEKVYRIIDIEAVVKKFRGEIDE